MVILSILFVIISVLLGYEISRVFMPTYTWLGVTMFTIGSLFIVILAKELQRLPFDRIFGTFLGFFSGILLSFLFSKVLVLSLAKPTTPIVLLVFTTITYISLYISYKKSEDITHLFFPKKERRIIKYKILDTSAIIDGRIADICDTGFIEETLLIPQFVLQELQHIADSTDPIKRARGRRGLDILRRIQTQTNVPVEIKDIDFPRIKEVDAKIIAAAKRYKAKIITTDYNLNKVAQLQGITVLNINELAASLRPVVLPGEEMKVKIIREGKEEGQGVGYMEDGTMVVVENGADRIGEELNVVVTSVLQTPAGRIIFTKPK